jgi:hypothetical protein
VREHCPNCPGDVGAISYCGAQWHFIFTVPSERWLGQRLSHILGRGDGADGVCAGIVFRNPQSLIAEITGTVDDDPWSPDAMVWHSILRHDRGCYPAANIVSRTHLALSGRERFSHRRPQKPITGSETKSTVVRAGLRCP